MDYPFKGLLRESMIHMRACPDTTLNSFGITGLGYLLGGAESLSIRSSGKLMASDLMASGCSADKKRRTLRILALLGVLLVVAKACLGSRHVPRLLVTVPY